MTSNGWSVYPNFPPTISKLSIYQSIQGTTSSVIVFGDNFRNYSRVVFQGGRVFYPENIFISSQQINFNIPTNASAGSYVLQIFNENLRSNAISFEIFIAPGLTGSIIYGNTGNFNYVYGNTGNFNYLYGNTGNFNYLYGNTGNFNYLYGNTGNFNYLYGNTGNFSGGLITNGQITINSNNNADSGQLLLTNSSNNTTLKITSGYRANGITSGYSTYEMTGVGTHFFWDNVEVNNDLYINNTNSKIYYNNGLNIQDSGTSNKIQLYATDIYLNYGNSKNAQFNNIGLSINKIDPTEALDVNGNIRANNFVFNIGSGVNESYYKTIVGSFTINNTTINSNASNSNIYDFSDYGSFNNTNYFVFLTLANTDLSDTQTGRCTLATHNSNKTTNSFRYTIVNNSDSTINSFTINFLLIGN